MTCLKVGEQTNNTVGTGHVHVMIPIGAHADRYDPDNNQDQITSSKIILKSEELCIGPVKK